MAPDYVAKEWQSGDKNGMADLLMSVNWNKEPCSVQIWWILKYDMYWKMLFLLVRYLGSPLKDVIAGCFLQRAFDHHQTQEDLPAGDRWRVVFREWTQRVGWNSAGFLVFELKCRYGLQSISFQQLVVTYALHLAPGRKSMVLKSDAWLWARAIPGTSSNLHIFECI